MKKGLTLLLLVLLLTGCKSEENTYFEDKKGDITGCTEDCLTDPTEFRDSAEAISVIINEAKDLLTQATEVTFKMLPSGETHNKEDIPWSQPLTDNYDIPVTQPFTMYDRMLYNMNLIMSNCSNDGLCTLTYLIGDSSLSKVDYGFNTTSGHYSFEATNDSGEIIRIEWANFNTDGDYGNFEQLIYFPQEKVYDYQIFQDGLYQHYKYNSVDNYEYTYIDINSKDSLYVYDGSNDIIAYYNHDKEFYYSYSEYSNSYTVKKYDDYEEVVSLKKNDAGYTYLMSFRFVDGWNKIEVTEKSPSIIFDKLYNDTTEVYSNYDVFTLRANIWYIKIYGRIELTIEQYDTQEFPSEFSGNTTMDKMKNELISFTNETNPINITGLSMEDILNKCVAYLTQFEEDNEIE